MSIYGPKVVTVSDETQTLVLTVSNAAVLCSNGPCNPAAADKDFGGDFLLTIRRVGLEVEAAEFFSQSVVNNKVTFMFGAILSQLLRGRYHAVLSTNGVGVDSFELALTDTAPAIVHVKTSV
jgi:hypothetical protein